MVAVDGGRLSKESSVPLAPPYHVQSTATNLRDGFPYFTHHDSVSALWSQKWRAPCAAGIYPFTDGKVEDFDPIFAELRRISDDDPSILYRPDDYATPFLPVAQQLVTDAEAAAANGSTGEARDLFLRAAAVYRIARFPVNRSPLSPMAWEKGKAAYEKGGRLLDPPSVPVDIPFADADTSAGDLDVAVQAYLRIPTGTRPNGGWPVLLFICGLDAYRTDHTSRTQAHVDHGHATLSFEIPGTGDCPAAPNDPTSPDRLMSSVIDWVVANASTHGFDRNKLVARGISTGGYYAFRIAHTHGDRLFAVVAQGGGCHHMFDAEWIGAQNRMEYPFALADALAFKFGYRDRDPVTAVARYAADAHKFSLVETGIVGTSTCRLLAINGMEDSIFPIEDNVIVATRGDKKDLVARGNRGHMGNPGAEDILYRWIDDAVAGKP
jgi:Esterase FrsA-like